MDITLWDAAKQLQLKSQAKTTLSLPPVIVMSDRENQGDMSELASRLPKNTYVILRDYNHPNREAYIKASAESLHEHSIPFSVAASSELAETVGAKGVHCPQWFSGALSENMMASASIHNLQELEKRLEDGHAYSFFLVSPVFQTASHNNATPLHMDALKLLQNTTSTPLYALGGISAGNINQLENMGFHGISGISLAA